MITNDPRVSHLDYYNYAGPCGWCGNKCGSENVCEPVAWLKRNQVTDFEDCLNDEKTSTTIITTAEGWLKIIIYNVTKNFAYGLHCVYWYANFMHHYKSLANLH